MSHNIYHHLKVYNHCTNLLPRRLRAVFLYLGHQRAYSENGHTACLLSNAQSSRIFRTTGLTHRSDLSAILSQLQRSKQASPPPPPGSLETQSLNQHGSPSAAATAATGGLTMDRFQPGWPDQSRRRSPQKTRETTNTKKRPRLIMAMATKVACTPIESTIGLM